jgi:tRNA-dihydrouridine synthase B
MVVAQLSPQLSIAPPIYVTRLVRVISGTWQRVQYLGLYLNRFDLKLPHNLSTACILVSSLTIGNLQFSNNLIQGPLAGISCAPFRRLASMYGKPAFTYTEMISCETLIHDTKNNHRFVAISPDEGPVCFQLSSKNPQRLGEAVKLVTDLGADLIDLNCGCPVNKIRTRGAGSKHLTNPSHLHDMITAMKSNTHVPVSIKIRVDGNSHDQYNQEVAQVVRDAGADFLTVHGRHWTDTYDVPCHYEQIQFFVDALNIPVIGNGDVACIESLKKMLSTGCAGAMIARAGVGQPWLFAKLLAELNEQPFELPPHSQIGELFLEHVSELIELMATEKFAVIQARKFAKYYARHSPNRAEFTNEVNQCEQFSLLQDIVSRYFMG